MIISRKEYMNLKTRVEVAENLITELEPDVQRSYLVTLDNWGAFSKCVYQSMADENQDRLDRLMGAAK